MAGMKRIAGLLRVSSDEQAKDYKTSLDSQAEVIAGYCKMRGFQMLPPETYCGPESATEGAIRPILGRLLDYAKRDLWDAVMVADHSRLSRDTKEGTEIAAVLRDNGKEYWAGSSQIDLNDPAEVMMMEFRTSMTKAEAAELKRKVMRNKFKAGDAKRWPYGEVPYGRLVNRAKEDGTLTWKINPAAKQKMESVYHWTVEKRLSQAQVAAKCGFKSRQHMAKSVRQAGAIGRYKQRQNPKAEFVVREVPIPPLLTDARIARILKIWASNAVGGGRRDPAKYPLTGKLRCATCEGVLVGGTRRKREYRHVRPMPTPDCTGSIIAKRIEDMVFQLIQESLDDKRMLTITLEAQMGSKRSRTAEVDARIAGLEKTVADLKREFRLKMGAVKLIKNDAALKIIAEDIDALGVQLASAEDELATATRERAAIAASKEDAAAIAARLQSLVNVTRWNQEDKLKALDVLFGVGTLRGKAGFGIFVSQRGGISFMRTVRSFTTLALIEPEIVPEVTRNACE